MTSPRAGLVPAFALRWWVLSQVKVRACVVCDGELVAEQRRYCGADCAQARAMALMPPI